MSKIARFFRAVAANPKEIALCISMRREYRPVTSPYLIGNFGFIAGFNAGRAGPLSAAL